MDAQSNLATVRAIHEAKGGIIQAARDSGVLAEDVEWIVPGPPRILPFAGTWHGLEGIAEFQRLLAETMRYDRAEILEYFADADHVGAIFLGEGVARATGRPFRSEILRLYTFRGGFITRVRNFYDTAIYVAAVRGED